MRKKRLDLGLLQREVAGILRVSTPSIQYWETNHVSPSIEFTPRIISFLGYAAYESMAEMSLGEKIRTCRVVKGLSQERLAEVMGIDPATLRRWERDEKKPIRLYLKALNEFMDPIAERRVADGPESAKLTVAASKAP
ncbi:MAG: transcriptional regulator [Candidatus Marsarchaeota archaeon]|nr:transcriptional regulator [Candidatus Marsarchaeota archaeon]